DAILEVVDEDRDDLVVVVTGPSPSTRLPSSVVASKPRRPHPVPSNNARASARGRRNTAAQCSVLAAVPSPKFEHFGAQRLALSLVDHRDVGGVAQRGREDVRAGTVRPGGAPCLAGRAVL